MHMRPALPRIAAAWIVGVLHTGCGAKEPSRFDVTIRVESDPGQPLEGAQVSGDNTTLATTDAEGSAQLSLSGAAGDVVALRVTCPSGHRSPEKPVSVRLKPLAEPGRKPEYRVLCPPLLRKLVVAVRAQNGANLPLKYLGKEIGRTDASGTCHALLKEAPGAVVTLTLDTSGEEHAKLMPQHPELKFTVPERDEVVVFDQTFIREPEAPVRPKKKRIAGPTRI